MNCPICGKALATGARKCVYCGDGTKYQRRQELQIPKNEQSKRRRSFPWGKLIAFLVLAGLVAAAFLHPDVNAKLKELISRF